MAGNDFGSEGAIEIAKSLPKSKLQTLVLDCMDISFDTRVIVLIHEGNLIDVSGVIAIAESLPASNLRSLRLDGACDFAERVQQRLVRR